nr:MAG TPA: hypothetical protein [Caudoviricetes sp.]
MRLAMDRFDPGTTTNLKNQFSYAESRNKMR